MNPGSPLPRPRKCIVFLTFSPLQPCNVESSFKRSTCFPNLNDPIQVITSRPVHSLNHWISNSLESMHYKHRCVEIIRACYHPILFDVLHHIACNLFYISPSRLVRHLSLSLSYSLWPLSLMFISQMDAHTEPCTSCCEL